MGCNNSKRTDVVRDRERDRDRERKSNNLRNESQNGNGNPQNSSNNTNPNSNKSILPPSILPPSSSSGHPSLPISSPAPINIIPPSSSFRSPLSPTTALYGSSYTNRKHKEYEILNGIVSSTRENFIDIDENTINLNANSSNNPSSSSSSFHQNDHLKYHSNTQIAEIKNYQKKNTIKNSQNSKYSQSHSQGTVAIHSVFDLPFNNGNGKREENQDDWVLSVISSIQKKRTDKVSANNEPKENENENPHPHNDTENSFSSSFSVPLSSFRLFSPSSLSHLSNTKSSSSSSSSLSPSLHSESSSSPSSSLSPSSSSRPSLSLVSFPTKGFPSLVLSFEELMSWNQANATEYFQNNNNNVAATKTQSSESSKSSDEVAASSSPSSTTASSSSSSSSGSGSGGGSNEEN